jgi:hypothetical protein
MLGVVNKAIQSFLVDTYGGATWGRVAREAQLGFDSFETLQGYDPALTEAVLSAAARILDRPREGLMEDMGTYLVSHPNRERLRRLLRFGGVGFIDFLHSLEDLPDRARLALPELDLPALTLADAGGDRFALACRFAVPGAGHVAMGMLRAMADDYGALVLLDHVGSGPEGEVIAIHLLDRQFAEGRRFDLAVLA